jgi:hypothetical protein
MKITLETMADPLFTEPTYPPATATQNQVRILERQVDEHVKCGTMLLKKLKTVYSLIYGQCSDAMRAKLELRPNHETIESACTAIQLLENIGTIMYQFQLQQYSVLALHEAKHHAGWMVMNLIGFFPGYPGEVWYNPDVITNILSLADAEKYFCVRYNSLAEKAFIVKKANGSIRWFLQTVAGLYYLDTATASRTEMGTALLLTVADKKSKKKLTSILRCRFVHHALLRTVDPRAWHTRVCGAM